MKASTSKPNNRLIGLGVALFWLGVWQIASMVIGEELFLSSPLAVFKTLLRLLGENAFWQALGGSFLRISVGYFTAMLGGILFAALCSRSMVLRRLFTPLFSVIRSTPVASFVILAIILFGSKNLAVIVSFLMVLPIIYTNTLAGIDSTDVGLLEMAKVFEINSFRKVRFIYLPSVMPFLLSGCSTALGLCWKSGIAAEVIGITGNSLGKLLYESKINFNTSELFAYTLVIIAVSYIFEQAVLFAVARLSESQKGGALK